MKLSSTISSEGASGRSSPSDVTQLPKVSRRYSASQLTFDEEGQFFQPITLSPNCERTWTVVTGMSVCAAAIIVIVGLWNIVEGRHS